MFTERQNRGARQSGGGWSDCAKIMGKGGGVSDRSRWCHREHLPTFPYNFSKGDRNAHTYTQIHKCVKANTVTVMKSRGNW